LGDSNLLKSSDFQFFLLKNMAIHPNPDRDISFMSSEHGTKCLITDYGSEKYLSNTKYSIPKDRYSKWCGGSGGFDDFVERWHE
jgi:hypothetical protein